MEQATDPLVRPKALVVEDDARISQLLTMHLDAAGFDVASGDDGLDAVSRLRDAAYELVILDVLLPGLDGVSVCRAVRGGGPNAEVPIIMLTACDGESDRVFGLESGADDYIVKPFGIREFLARVTAVTRRRRRLQPAESQSELGSTAGPVNIDVDKRRVTVRGEVIDLTRQEFDLLHRLMSRRGIVFSRASLLQMVWKDDGYVTERTVDAVISRLRRKVEIDPRDPELILTAWGVGYNFADAN